MQAGDTAARIAWGGLALVVAASGAVLVDPGLAVPALILAVMLSALTLATTRGSLRALRRQAAAYEHDSLHDPVTELPNRTLFDQQVQQAIAGADRRESRSAVMLLDLDRFKEVNDTLGHHQGDVLLCQVANRLRANLRAGDLVARLGGDEFAVFALDLDSVEEAYVLAERLRGCVAETVELAGISLEIESSAGLSICPDHGRDVEVLLRRADVAMYEAKRHHTGVELYNATTDASSRQRLRLLADLRAGLSRGEIVVHYQPKMVTRTGDVRGFEALVRWQHPRHGLLFPDQFISLAENTGLMRPLTSLVLDAALAQCRAWRGAGHGNVTMAVNLSTRNLLDKGLPTEVTERLAAHGLPPSALELEITETTIMVDPQRAGAVLDELAELGVGLAIDDFGTGYTSLSWLGNLPLTTLKIDKSFVMRMTDHAKDAAIVRTSVQLGQNLGLSVVAEGIEHSEAWKGLDRLGCDYVQGYFFSRPQAPEALDAWLRDHPSVAAA